MFRDLRYALRQLRKSPVFTVVAVLAIALGIGANTAIFSVVNAVLLRPLPYQDSDRLVTILHEYDHPVAPANYLDWRAQNHVFEDIGVAESWTPNLSGSGQAESVNALQVSANLFPILGVQPLLGRVFLADEDQRGKERVVILSYGLWKRHFGGDRGIVGQAITLQGHPYTVIGVMPKSFRFAPFWATKAELWAPLELGPRLTSREVNSLRAFARLKPEVSVEQARSEMATITARLEQQFPGTNRNVTVQLLKEKVVGDVRPALLVLLAAVSFVLLIACANVGHMLMARGAARQREIAVRAALGAERWRIVRQFLIESLLLALLGGAAGLLLAFWGIHVLLALVPASMPRADSIGLDARVLLFTAVVSILTGIVFGLVPALQSSALNLRDALQESGRGSGESLQRNRLRSALVGSEFALAFLLMIGAGLMVRTFFALRAIDPGFQPHHVLTAVVSIAGSEEAQPQKRFAFYQQVLHRVAALPGIESVSAINHVPLAGDTWGFPFAIEGRPPSRPGESPNAVYRVVFPGYFRTMGISLLRGRDISESDSMNAPGVVIVNDRLARRYWPSEDPIGKRITLDDTSEKDRTWLTVIGVTQDAKQDEWTAAPRAEMYLPLLQSRFYLQEPSGHFEYITLVVRTSGDPAAIANDIKSSIAALDKNVPVSEIETMDQAVDDLNAQPRFELWLLTGFAVLAVLLAALGIYGVMSYSVSRRTHELGVRMALGATHGDVIKLVVRQAMMLALVGSACGLTAAVLLTRMMSGLLYGVRPTDPFTFGGVLLLVSAVALAASYIPARRATRIDPVSALRCE
jgi:predicted permease